MVFFTTPELLEIGDIPMTSLNEKPGRMEALKYYRRVADHYGLNIHQYEERTVFDGSDEPLYRADRGSHGGALQLRARKVILASGYYDIPNRLEVPGADLDKVIHYYREAHPYYDSDVLIVGAKNSACIAALELFWTGARVTMVSSRRRAFAQRQILDQAQYREPYQSGEVKIIVTARERDPSARV